MSENEPLSIALIGIFLVLSAFFSSSEAAFLSLQRTRLAHLVSSGTPGAGRVADMVREPERLLSTILLGNNLVNVAFTALLTVLIVSALGEDREGQSVLIATGRLKRYSMWVCTSVVVGSSPVTLLKDLTNANSESVGSIVTLASLL